MLNTKRALEVLLASSTILATSVAVQAATIRVTVETVDGNFFWRRSPTPSLIFISLHFKY